MRLSFNIRYVLIGVVIIATSYSCKNDYTPKPRGYFRIDLPKREYKRIPDLLPYSFEISNKALLTKYRNSPEKLNWVNIEYPKLKATIYLSYKKVNSNLEEYLNDSRRFVYKHTIKADAIDEKEFINPEKKVYGIKYDIKGDAASNIQFFLTDSTSNFVRGALYFNVLPNKDSLAPVIEYINEDILHMIETFEWR